MSSVFVFHLGFEVKPIKLVLGRPSECVAPSATVKRRRFVKRRVSFANLSLLNYFDHQSEEPIWFTNCETFQTMTFSKRHGLVELFTPEGRELWGNIFYCMDVPIHEKFEWSNTFRSKIRDLDLLDLPRHKLRVSSTTLHNHQIQTMGQLQLFRDTRAAEAFALKFERETARLKKEKQAQELRAMLSRTSPRASPKFDTGLRLK